ncbi:MAG: biotin synthase BioB [Desulfotalea sp.]
MTKLIESSRKNILETGLIDFEQACSLLSFCHNSENLNEVRMLAEDIRLHFHGNKIELCSIVNAKAGKCSEDCRFCAQSSYYNTDVETYPLISGDMAVDLAIQNEKHGVSRFSLVTAGRKMSLEAINSCREIYQDISTKTKMDLCASMGFLSLETAQALYDSGVTRYHCNLETASSYFSKICTSHSWQDKVDTMKIATKVGMDLCSGGIIGLGESGKQRLELAFELRELGVKSIPINILNPIIGTPMADIEPLSLHEIQTTFALFRLINPKAIIRTAGGRNLLGGNQYSLFQSGANGAIVGDYLTTSGDGLAKDVRRFAEIGFKI